MREIACIHTYYILCPGILHRERHTQRIHERKCGCSAPAGLLHSAAILSLDIGCGELQVVGHARIGGCSEDLLAVLFISFSSFLICFQFFHISYHSLCFFFSSLFERHLICQSIQRPKFSPLSILPRGGSPLW